MTCHSQAAAGKNGPGLLPEGSVGCEELGGQFASFRKKCNFLLAECDEILEATNYWRLPRDEKFQPL